MTVRITVATTDDAIFDVEVRESSRGANPPAAGSLFSIHFSRPSYKIVMRPRKRHITSHIGRARGVFVVAFPRTTGG